jgi:hypothetical protein
MKQIELKGFTGTTKGLNCEKGCASINMLGTLEIVSILKSISETYPSLENDISNINNKLESLSFNITYESVIGFKKIDFKNSVIED